jgi:sugar diacid utilization regulator
MFLRENLYRAGIGNEVPGIRRLHTGYLQAKAALEIGRNSRSTDWYYKFDNMVLPYIWQQGTKEMEVTDLYHPAVCMLMEYDKKQGTSLAQTVFSYMKNSYNVTHTAQELYIHRTTLLFRLERIEALTGLKWDDWSTRVHLAITFELLQWSNRKW